MTGYIPNNPPPPHPEGERASLSVFAIIRTDCKFHATPGPGLKSINSSLWVLAEGPLFPIIFPLLVQTVNTDDG